MAKKGSETAQILEELRLIRETFQQIVPLLTTIVARFAAPAADEDGAFTSEEDNDDLYPEAKKLVISAGKASTSYLQRKLGIGYARAARLMDMLEEKCVIGPGDGARPRRILSTLSKEALETLAKIEDQLKNQGDEGTEK